VPKPNCHRCEHFQVTWDKRTPYECRAFGFRSTRIPLLIVRETSGHDCQLFTPKPSARGEDTPSPDSTP